VVTADKLILEWDTFLTHFNDLREIEMETIQMSTWSTMMAAAHRLKQLEQKCKD
jgi:hypothetical protein